LLGRLVVDARDRELWMLEEEHILVGRKAVGGTEVGG
jgi:hypothetical protein